MKTIRINPEMTEAYESWEGILDLAIALPDQWSIAGGQMVYVHTVEHEASLARPSKDADVVIDVRGHKGSSESVFQALLDIGFQRQGFDLEGRSHRWIRGEAQIDVLQPRHLGDRKYAALKRRKLHTIEAPGSQHLLARSELVQISLGTRTVAIRRPDLMGAIAAKSAAYKDIVNDSGRERHIVDVLSLSPLLSARAMRRSDPWKKLERRRIDFVSKVAIARHEETLLGYFPVDLQERIEALKSAAQFYVQSSQGS